MSPSEAAGNNRGLTIDIGAMVREYCQVMDWDTKTAKPSPARLRALGLEFLARDMG